LTTELPADAFAQMPPTQTNAVQMLRYMTDPLSEDLLIAGPSVLNLFAAIDQDDTNWIVSLKDVGPDGSVRTVRERRTRTCRAICHERELTRGWLKASHRAVDSGTLETLAAVASLDKAGPEESRSRRNQPSTPSRFWRLQICSGAVIASASTLRARTCRQASAAPPTPSTSPITSSAARPRCIKIYHDGKRPSHLLLPVIPQG